MLMTTEHPTSGLVPDPNGPSLGVTGFMRLGIILEAWSTGGPDQAMSICKHLAEARPAAARVAVLEIEGLLLHQRWIPETGLPMQAAAQCIKALGGPTRLFFEGSPVENGLRLVPPGPPPRPGLT